MFQSRDEQNKMSKFNYLGKNSHTGIEAQNS